MATDVQPSPAALAGQVLFYQNPEPLDSARHARLGMMNSNRPYGFSRKQHFVPLHVGEFGPAAINYPIIFAGDQYSPLAVLGINLEENLFVGADGEWRPGAYIPAFVRRYPFVTARDEPQNRMIVCIDRAFELFTENNPDTLLFENGQPSEFTKRCIQFCTGFDTDSQATAGFVQLLRTMDMFEPKQTTFTPRLADGSEGQPVLISEYYAVSQTKLNALTPAQLGELHKTGALIQIYAHLISLNGWDRLIIETAARAARAGQANA